MTGIVLVSPPQISTSELLFNEEETRQIFCFFWPNLTSPIKEMEVTDDKRCLAQELLITAIDSTYAMGFMESLVKGVYTRPSGFNGLLSMGRKLASSYFKHWWKHAKQDDLRHPRIAEAVRGRIAINFKSAFELVIREANARPRLHPFYMASVLTTYWGGA